jgi:hypothetical protein
LKPSTYTLAVGLTREVVALLASPGPRRGRELVRWQHAIVLVLAAAAVQVSTIVVTRTWVLPFFGQQARPTAYSYLVIAAALGVASAGLAATFRLNEYFLLMLAGFLYPWVVQVVTSAAGGSVLLGRMWIAVPSTLVPLAYLYIPPLLLACAVTARVIRWRRAGPAPA